MCLDTITQKIADPSPLIVGGWKQFRGGDDKPYFQVCALDNKDAVPLDKWITAEKSPISERRGYRSVDYDSGFHIYSDEKHKPSAAKWLVFYRKVEVIGTQETYPCVIAREMYVPSKPDAWPPPR